MYAGGQFIKITKSNYPSLIVQKMDCNELLVSIIEFNGDYTIVDTKIDDIKLLYLPPEEELFVISSFGDWYYEHHQLLYTEIIIKNIKI